MKKQNKDIAVNYEKAFLAWIIRLEARLEALENDSHPEKIFVMPGEFESKMDEIDKRLVDIESRLK